MIYKIIFDDGIVYESPDIRSNDPGWASEDRAKLVGIRKISIILPNKQIIVLKGFEKYNFFVEAVQSFGGINGGGVRIEVFYFCGVWRGCVVSWEINCKTQQIIKKLVKAGEEYYGTATRGWRMGLMGQKPYTKMV